MSPQCSKRPKRSCAGCRHADHWRKTTFGQEIEREQKHTTDRSKATGREIACSSRATENTLDEELLLTVSPSATSCKEERRAAPSCTTSSPSYAAATPLCTVPKTQLQ